MDIILRLPSVHVSRAGFSLCSLAIVLSEGFRPRSWLRCKCEPIMFMLHISIGFTFQLRHQTTREVQ